MGFYKNWILGSRPWSLSMTFISIAVGFSLAAENFGFSPLLFLLTLIAGSLVHLASNLLNDYYDVKNGVDSESVGTAKYRPHPILHGKLSLKRIFAVSMSMYLIASFIGTYLVFTRGLLLLWIGLGGIFLAMSYTAPPLKYKYKGFGEIAVMMIWGPLMTGGSYYIQSLSISWSVIIVSIPFALLVALVLFANNLRDYESDKSNTITTISILFGLRRSLHFYVGLIVLAYLWVIIISIVGPLTLWSLIVLLSLPISVHLIRKTYQHVPDNADAETGRFVTVFGILLLISIVVGNYFL